MRQQQRVTREDVEARLLEEFPNASITYYEASHSNGRYRWQQLYISGTRYTNAIYRKEETLLFLMIYFNRLVESGERTSKENWWSDRKAIAMNRAAKRYGRARRSGATSSAPERSMRGLSMAGCLAQAA